jgi:glutamate synthase domain-containing protein 1/glutamate synthase domain-containing protein 3
MCGIVGYWDKSARSEFPIGRMVLSMLEALACRGPDSAGIAVIGPEPPDGQETWLVRITPSDVHAPKRLAQLGTIVSDSPVDRQQSQGRTLQFRFAPEPGLTVSEFERALGACRAGLEVLSLGRRLDLVKQVGSPSELEAAFGVSTWRGPLAIGHTRMSTESRIDLSHSQPFWVHGAPDLATVHNGHVTNYHQLRRRFEQQGTTFYTDNDSEVIGVYLRARMEQGRSLGDAMADSIQDLDGAFSYLVASANGLGIVRDRFGFKPLVLAETNEFVAVATEEVALRRALVGDFHASEPPPCFRDSIRSSRTNLALSDKAVSRTAELLLSSSIRSRREREGPAVAQTTSREQPMETIECGDLAVRVINQRIRAAISAGVRHVRLLHPGARHNLGVGLPEGVELTVAGSVGYYVAGLNDGASVVVQGDAGWGAAEGMRDGSVVIEGSAGNAVAASIRSGTVVVRGTVSTRAGIAMKGGILIVAGSVGPMAGFMMQKGVLIVCGDAGAGLADSMYAGTVFLGGRHDELGADAVFADTTPADFELIGAALEQWNVKAPSSGFRKLVAGRKLWNFERSNRELWQTAL